MPANRYPIYIVSKGRASRTRAITARFFDEIKVPYNLVVEHHERAAYAEAFPSARIVVLDPQYKDDYDQLTDEPGAPGSGPARNFAWDHAASEGHARYWCMDDNLRRFMYFGHNTKMPCGDATGIWMMEQVTDLYENVYMSGPNYRTFDAR